LIPVQFHSEAEAELGEAASFYESRLVGLGTSFSAEVQTSVRFIRTYPDAGSPLGRKLRVVVVKRIPYSVIYRRDEHCIYIVAVAHHRRRPGYWKGR
jgi:hypothetical protein